MQIAVASGKGGTGKTTVATALVLSLARAFPPDYHIGFLDCDVEAPDAHLFLHPAFEKQQPAIILIPKVDQTLCTGCGKCVEVCQFHALARIGTRVIVFPQLCHGCGSCTINCPVNAITEEADPIGLLEAGHTDTGIDFARGTLTISEPIGNPDNPANETLEKRRPAQIVILDAPPGASCSVVETLRGCEFYPAGGRTHSLGLHDCETNDRNLARDGNSSRGHHKPGRDGNKAIDDFCKAEDLPGFAAHPFDRGIAEGTAKGQPLTQYKPGISRKVPPDF